MTHAVAAAVDRWRPVACLPIVATNPGGEDFKKRPVFSEKPGQAAAAAPSTRISRQSGGLDCVKPFDHQSGPGSRIRQDENVSEASSGLSPSCHEPSRTINKVYRVGSTSRMCAAPHPL